MDYLLANFDHVWIWAWLPVRRWWRRCQQITKILPHHWIKYTENHTKWWVTVTIKSFRWILFSQLILLIFMLKLILTTKYVFYMIICIMWIQYVLFMITVCMYIQLFQYLPFASIIPQCLHLIIPINVSLTKLQS